MGDNPVNATLITGATFHISNAKLYIVTYTVVNLSINNNINFIENIKQGFTRANSWKKYRFEITTQPRKQ